MDTLLPWRKIKTYMMLVTYLKHVRRLAYYIGEGDIRKELCRIELLMKFRGRSKGRKILDSNLSESVYVYTYIHTNKQTDFKLSNLGEGGRETGRRE